MLTGNYSTETEKKSDSLVYNPVVCSINKKNNNLSDNSDYELKKQKKRKEGIVKLRGSKLPLSDHFTTKQVQCGRRATEGTKTSSAGLIRSANQREQR